MTPDSTLAVTNTCPKDGVHLFTSLAHTQVIIEAWRREYNEERPKKGLGGLTPAHYARQLMANGSTVTVGL